MKAPLLKLFNLFPGEGRPVFLFGLLAFFWSFGTYASVTIADGFFLQKIGSTLLPEAYFLIAISLFSVASLFLWAFNHFDAFRIYRIVLLACSLGLVIIAAYLYLGEPGTLFWFMLKVFCNTFTVALTTCFWFFLDQYFNTQNAKRLYTLFSSSIFLGNGLGSLFIAATINSIGVHGVLLVLALLFILTYMTVHYITKSETLVFDDLTESTYHPEKQPLTLVIKGFIKSRFTLLLMGTYLVVQILYIVTELSYMKGFERYFATQDASGSNDLIIFLSKCTALISLVNIIFGLFFYSRMVSRIGVNTATLISPVFFLAAFIGTGIFPGILITVFSLIVVEAVSYVMDENNSNLLLNTVPSHLKNKARVAIDSFFEPLGMLISAVAFLVFPISTSAFGLVLTFICLSFALMIRKEYRYAVWGNLRAMALSFRLSLNDWISRLNEKDSRKTKQELLMILRQPDETAKLTAFELLFQFDDPKILPKLIFQASRFSLKNRIKALELIEKSRYCRHPEVIDRLRLWAREVPGTPLQKTIFLYLAKLALLPLDQLPLDSSELITKKALILSLKTSWAHLDPSTIAQNHLKAQAELEILLSSNQGDELAAGISILGFEKTASHIERVLSFINHPLPEVALAAAVALESIIDAHGSYHANFIINALPKCVSREERLYCLKALYKIASSSLIEPLITISLHFRPSEKRLIEKIILEIGSQAVGPLAILLADESLHDPCRILAARILAKISPETLTENIRPILLKELQRAYFHFHHGFQSTLKETIGVDISWLQDVVLAEYHSALDLVVQFVSLAGSFEESELLSRAIHNKNPKTRGKALETLEKTCEKKLWALLKPLLDERPLSDKLRFSCRFVAETLSAHQLIDYLQNAACHTTQLTVMALKAKGDLPGWKELAMEKREGKKGLYYQFATELIGG